MWFFWIMCIVPALIGAAFLYFDKKVTWQEWLGGIGASLLLAGIFQLCSFLGRTADVETWSGVITQTTRYGAWVEQYEEAHTETYACGTDSKGNTTYCTRTYYTTEYAHHGGNNDVDRNFGTIEDSPGVEQQFHDVVQANFGGGVDATYNQSCTHGGHYYSGDRTAYVTRNKTGYIHPVTMTKYFKNKVKAAPSLFSFAKVPTNITVFPWPANGDWANSERVMGTAKNMVSTYDWDVLNTQLGPTKKINLIIVGFPAGTPTDMAQWQQAKWIGGKKNDLVIVFGGGSQTAKADWVDVFGWTEKDIVKHNIESLFLNNPVNKDILPKIAAEVNLNYVKKDWHKFDYITIEPPTWSYWLYAIVMLLVEGGLYAWFHFNEFDNTHYNEQVDFHGVEEALLEKLKRKWKAFVGFFIKPKPVLVQQQVAVAAPAPVVREDPSPYFSLYQNENAPRPVIQRPRQKAKRNRVKTYRQW